MSVTWKRGDTLSAAAQRAALGQFVHRYTGEHTPGWAKGQPRCPVQFEDDAEWLANSYFAVTKAGNLHGRYTACDSYPTWPDGESSRPASLNTFVRDHREYTEGREGPNTTPRR